MYTITTNITYLDVTAYPSGKTQPHDKYGLITSQRIVTRWQWRHYPRPFELPASHRLHNPTICSLYEKLPQRYRVYLEIGEQSIWEPDGVIEKLFNEQTGGRVIEIAAREHISQTRLPLKTELVRLGTLTGDIAKRQANAILEALLHLDQMIARTQVEILLAEEQVQAHRDAITRQSSLDIQAAATAYGNELAQLSSPIVETLLQEAGDELRQGI